MEIIDNWEWVIKGSDLTNNTIRLEDAEMSCALIREIGTDNGNLITFGVEDITYIKIDKLIAPFYKSTYNLNRMQFSQYRDGKWVSTGFELPIPIDSDIFINNLGSDNRVYLKGTLFKGVLRADDPINRYLRARMVEVPYKNLYPIYYQNVEIPSTFSSNSKFVLRTDNVSSPTLEAWDPTNPHYTIVPEKNEKYVLNNPIEVLWQHEELDAADVEFRIWYDGTEDLKVRPRLDHMLLPPSDGKSKYVTENKLITTAQVKAYDVAAGGVPAAGSGVDITMATAAEAGKFAPGVKALLSDGTNYEIVTVLDSDSTAGTVTVDKVSYAYDDAAAGNSKLYLPATQLMYQPLAPVDVLNNPGGGIVAVDYANGLVFVTAGHDTTNFQFGYYAHYEVGGKDIFTMRALPERYRILEDPHKLSFIFINRGSDVTTTGSVTVYTLAQVIKSTPPEVAAAIARTKGEAQTAGYPV